MIELPVYLIHWNAPDWLASSVDSIMDSEGVSVRVVVIDNGPEGGLDLRTTLPTSVEVLKAHENLGFAGGANLGLKHWTHSLPECPVAVIGSHDLHVAGDALGNLVQAAEENSVYGVIGPQLVAPLPSSGGRWHHLRATSVPATKTMGLVRRDWITGTCMLIRRQVLVDVGGFDERFGSYVEDVDFCLRAQASGWGVGVDTRARAWGLGSASHWTPVLIATNTVYLCAKQAGRPGAVVATGRVAGDLMRTAVAARLPWRTRGEKSRSRAYTRRYAAALRASVPFLLHGPDAITPSRPQL